MKLENMPQFNKKEKLQEKLQAQVEIFSNKNIDNFSKNQAQILKYSAELSKIKDLDNLPSDLPEEIMV